MSSAQQPVKSTALAVPAWAESALRPFLASGEYDLLLPALPVSGDLGAGLMPAVSIVKIDPNPQNGEVFKVGARKDDSNRWENLYSYAKPGLEKLAAAAGIQIRTRRVDDRKDRDYVEFEAIGGMRGESGEIVMRAGTAGVRFSEYAEDRWTEIQAANAKAKEQEPEAKLRAAHQSEMAQYRKHMVSRVETKASLRVIRSLLAIKSQLTAAQVARPKVLLRVNLDMRDPEVRGALLSRGLTAGALLYGAQAARSSAEVVESEAPVARPALTAAEPEDGDEPLGPVTEDAGAAAAPDPKAYFEEGCRQLGLGITAAAAVLAKAQMDYSVAGRLLDRMAEGGEK